MNYTLVSGLWNIGREGRGFEDHYIPRFKEFLKIDAPMILFLPFELHEMVWEIRDKSNTFIKTFELEDFKQNLYKPHWDKTQEIRTNEEWLNITGPGGWLPESPQAKYEYYNPIVQSKMFMLHDASVFNNFQTDYYYWVDAGLSNTVPATHMVEDRCFDKIVDVTDPWIFLSFPYEARDEIHGFDIEVMKRMCKGVRPEYVCRGGLWGGHKEQIAKANGFYYGLLADSLYNNVMGTEETLFTIMSYLEPQTYRRYMLDDNGLIVKFTEALLKDTVDLVEIKQKVPKASRIITKEELNKVKTNLYILTFNFPDQLMHTINSMKKVKEWLKLPHLVLLDNSTDKKAQKENKKIAEEYNFEYVWLEGNTGICGGRQKAAEHFHESDADYYFFFEDDMTVNSSKEKSSFCRNGLRKYVPNLYQLLHKIMIREEFDFLKLSFSEVYWDNNIQTAWYNVPQDIRTRDWPHYDQLPVNGSDENAPRTEFNNINNLEGLAYIDGAVTYTNWPMIMSRKGNKKVFIDTKWAHPFEQTWMSHAYQMYKEGRLNPAVCLASPIWHERILYYEPEERVES